MSSLPATLQGRIDPARLMPSQVQLVQLLLQLDQAHLFAGWEAAGTDDDRKLALLDQVEKVHAQYPGGIGGYLAKARELLARDSAAAPAVESPTLEKPEVVDLASHDARYRAFEENGLRHGREIAFVLVAGGLGERLGHDGIKMGIPIELMTRTTYMQLYCEFIKALEDRVNAGHKGERIIIPFFIMTSGGTQARTAAFLRENRYFGLRESQVRVFEQHLVPSITDRAAHLALENPYSLLLKPNGHGDVHSLLHEQGFARSIRETGKTHLVLIQDTNAQIVDLILPAVGVTIEEDYDFNFVCVPRVPGEPLGAVIRLREGGQSRTFAVEYNVLDQFLRRTTGKGDCAAANGLSAFPGSINLLVVKLDSYLDVLARTKGAVAEFINPKYADADRNRFASPTRLETLMQDLADAYEAGARIGATVFNRDWALAALKNNLTAAKQKAQAKEPTYSAAEAETGFYRNSRIRLDDAGVQIEPAAPRDFHGIDFPRAANVVLSRAFALTLADARPKLKNVRLSRDATLVLNGAEIYLEDVELKQTSGLILNVCSGARLRVRGLVLDRKGVTLRSLSDGEIAQSQTPSILKMRGYTTTPGEPLVINITKPGDYLVGADGVCRKLAETATAT